MEQKGLTKKQFWIQIGLNAYFMLMAVWWIVTGVLHESPLEWILGSAYFVFVAAYSVYLILLRKRHPVENDKVDEEVMDNFKSSMKAMGIVFAFLTGGFLIAFGLVAVLK